MDSQDIHSRLLSRRTLLRRVVVGVAGVSLLGACAPTPAPSTAAPTAAPPASTAAPAAKPTVASAPPTAAPAPKPTAPTVIQKLKITLPGIDATAIHNFIARDYGIWKKYGLDTEITTAPANTGLQATLAGDFDLSGSAGSVVGAAMAGAPIRLVLELVDRPLAWLYAKPPIKTLADLKGKTVAVSAAGGADEVFLRSVMRKQGMDADQDIVFLNMGASDQRLAPLIAGAVESSTLALPGNVLAREAGFNEVAFFGETLRSAYVGYGATPKTISERRALVKAVIAASLEAVDFYKTHPSEAKETLQKELNLDPKLVDGVYQTMIQSYTPDGTASPDSMKENIVLQAEVLKVSPNVDPSQVFDFSIVQEVNAERKR